MIYNIIFRPALCLEIGSSISDVCTCVIWSHYQTHVLTSEHIKFDKITLDAIPLFVMIPVKQSTAHMHIDLLQIPIIFIF